MKRFRGVIFCCFAALFLAGCTFGRTDVPSKVDGGIPTPTNTPVPTDTPIPTDTPTPTNTPTPMNTPTPTPITHDPIEGLPVCSLYEAEKISASLNTLKEGERTYVNVSVIPYNAYGGFTYEIKDTSIATVDHFGRVTALKSGMTELVVTASNGVSTTTAVKVARVDQMLTFELTEDKKGYVLTGCNPLVYTVNIPSKYNGLPVKEIAGEAFVNCEQLKYFTTDPDQQYFYTEDGVLFTDVPVRTLVKMPNQYLDNGDERQTYSVPEGTVVIADYAFGGFNPADYSSDIFFPEGVTTFGNRVFYGIKKSISVYVPESLTSIGEEILLDQYENVPFFGKTYDLFAAKYADEHFIPYGSYYVNERSHEPAETFIPQNPIDADYVSPNANDIVCVNIKKGYFDFFNLYRRIDVSEEQKGTKKEVRVLFEDTYSDIIPDKYGKVLRYLPAMTGLYGVGHTDTPATVVGYDIGGNITQAQTVSGDFAFCLEGAVELGVAGGSNTTLIVVPYEPTFISSPGYLQLKPDEWIKDDHGKGMRFVFATVPYSTFSLDLPIYLNEISFSETDVKGTGYRETSDTYRLINLEFSDDTRLELSGQCYLFCDGLKTYQDDDDLFFAANGSYDISEGYAEDLADLLKTVKETMVGVYYPAEAPINKIQVIVNGNYPSSSESKIELDEYDVNFISARSTLAHELVHAVDQSIEFFEYGQLSTWMEGRAEYISYLVERRYDPRTYLKYPDRYDWSFLNEQDKADFEHYYLYGMNRQTPYTVGYYFFKYINEIYGEDISSKIMDKLAGYSYADMNKMTVDEEYAVFSKALKELTSETVFQDFVRDVIEGEGLSFTSKVTGETDVNTTTLNPNLNMVISDEFVVSENMYVSKNIMVEPGAKLIVDNVLTIQNQLTVSRDDLDVSKGRIKLEWGSSVNLDDVSISVKKNPDVQYYGEIFLYERNGKLKFTGGTSVKVEITVPEGKSFEDYFEATNLEKDAVIICNGVEIRGKMIDPVKEIKTFMSGDFLITEDTVLGNLDDYSYEEIRIRKAVTLKQVPGNKLGIVCPVNLYGTIDAVPEDFRTMSYWVRIYNGGKIILGDISIECKSLETGIGGGNIVFRARIGEKYSLEIGKNVKVYITMPENADFKDIFALDGNNEEMEIYINGSSTPYTSDDILARLALGNEKEMVISKDETVTSYLKLPANRTITVLPEVTLRLDGIASIEGTLKFYTGSLFSSWMWFDPGATIVIDDEVILKCRVNEDCDEDINRAEGAIFDANLKGKHRIRNGYACIIDITMPKGKTFDDYFVFEDSLPGMIINVNGRRIY